MMNNISITIPSFSSASKAFDRYHTARKHFYINICGICVINPYTCISNIAKNNNDIEKSFSYIASYGCRKFRIESRKQMRRQRRKLKCKRNEKIFNDYNINFRRTQFRFASTRRAIKFYGKI